MPWRSPYFLVGQRLRRASRGLTKRPHDGAPRQADLEVVVPIALGTAQQDVRGSRECARVGALAAQDDFGRGAPPWFMRNAAERQASFLDRVAVKFERCCD
jgi:hypothetical protein